MSAPVPVAQTASGRYAVRAIVAAVSARRWQATAETIEQVLTQRFGVAPARASVSFLGVEPIDILRYPTPDVITYCSLGMARRPMSPADAALVDDAGPRAELLLDVIPDGSGAEDIWRSLAIFAVAPAVEGVVYAPGITVDSGRSFAEGSRCTGAIVVESDIADVRTGDGLVSFLRLLPATADELAWARVRGARALRELWAEQRVDPRDVTRAAARLG